MMTERLISRKYWVLALVILFTGCSATRETSSSAVGSKQMDASHTPQASQASGTPSAKSESLIWVTRKDGATSCGTSKGQTLDEGASELQRNGVRVLGSRKGNDGKMHAQACGMPTGSLNAYQISRDDLPKALVLGYQEDHL
jgi:hypothetical protein